MATVLKVVLPLSMPGVASGILMVFMPTISTFAISELLTMNNIKLFGTTIQENINNSMWNYGAADRKSTRLNSSHLPRSRMPSSA